VVNCPATDARIDVVDVAARVSVDATNATPMATATREAT
jgi:hypothetical protein